MNDAPRPAGATAGLIERAREGDREAYDTLFAHAADRAMLFIRLRLGRGLRGKLDSMDVLQEAYLEAHRAFPRFEDRGEGAFARWLCRIIENRIRGLADHHGARKRKPPKGGLRVSRVIERVRASGTGPVTRADRGEERERLARALEGLPKEDREVLLLRFFQDLSLDEIAATVGRSRSSVRRALGEATARLGRELSAAGGGTDGAR